WPDTASRRRSGCARCWGADGSGQPRQDNGQDNEREQGPMSTIWVDLLGTQVKYYDAAGLRTRAIEAGSGDALILLHGSGGHAEAYTRNVVPLAEHFRVCSVDMIGHGLT